MEAMGLESNLKAAFRQGARTQNVIRLCVLVAFCLLESHLSSYAECRAVLPSNLWGLMALRASMDTASLADPPDRHTGHALPHPGDGPLRPGGP